MSPAPGTRIVVLQRTNVLTYGIFAQTYTGTISTAYYYYHILFWYYFGLQTDDGLLVNAIRSRKTQDQTYKTEKEPDEYGRLINANRLA